MAELKIKNRQRVDAYHDGKHSPSSLVSVVVDDVLSRYDMNKRAQRMWKSAIVKDFHDVFCGCSSYCGPNGLFDATTTKQFWDWNCDKFIVGHIIGRKDTEKDPILFAKRLNGFGWYGINWNYSLDIGGRVRRRCLPRWKKCAEEMGHVIKWNAKVGCYDYFDKKTGKKID